MSIIKNESPYPIIKVILAHQFLIMTVTFLLVFTLLAAYSWNALGGYGLVVGVLVGAIMAVILKSYIEVLEIIADTLMPQ